MKGLELAKAYYEQYGLPMLQQQFPQYMDRIAVGLVGHGSECFGFDDGISRDHDFEPGFCLWLTPEDEKEFGFKLFRAYRKLPKEFGGVQIEQKSLFGADGKGVHTIDDFYAFYTGTGRAPESNEEWLAIPDCYLAEATNGEVWSDPLGVFSAIRETLKNGMPEDVRLKKLASAVFHMAQKGQYNYARCLAHGEKAAAALMLAGFARAAAGAVFLCNRAHAPYDKWLFRALRALPLLGTQTADRLEMLLAAPYDRTGNTQLIEQICADVAQQIRAQDLSERTEAYLEGYAYCIRDKIRDNNLRNSPVML